MKNALRKKTSSLLTRIEKWRVNLFWIFIERIQVLSIEDYEDFSNEIEQVEQWLKDRGNAYSCSRYALVETEFFQFFFFFFIL